MTAPDWKHRTALAMFAVSSPHPHLRTVYPQTPACNELKLLRLKFSFRSPLQIRVLAAQLP
jgi:hypothetical protein